MTISFTEKTWTSPDGLELYFRDYGEASERPPVICLHGLTRNSRDFAELAAHIAGQGWRVLVPDMRGRGKSEYASDSATYAVPIYVGDLLALLAQEEIERFVSIGTSMGGIITMVLAAMQPGKIAGAVLNDIGPVIETEGLDRIKNYVGQGRSFPTWMHAARTLQDLHGPSHPKYGIEDWLSMAKRSMVVGGSGRIVFDYDMKIAEPILAAGSDAAAVPPDMWPAFEALAGKPLLVVRGGISALFSSDTLAEMHRRIPDMRSVTVDEVGHAPMMDETEVRAAIDALLAQVG